MRQPDDYSVARRILENTFFNKFAVYCKAASCCTSRFDSFYVLLENATGFFFSGAKPPDSYRTIAYLVGSIVIDTAYS